MTFKLNKTDAAVFIVYQTVIIACLPALILLSEPIASIGASVVLIAVFAATILFFDWAAWVFITRPQTKRRIIFKVDKPLTDELIENYTQRLALRLKGDLLEERQEQKGQ